MKKIFFVFNILLSCIIFGGCSSIDQKPQKPNILFVFADQLRSQELSCYGGVNIKTPNLDRLADEGLKFTNAFSTYPICSPFRGMLMTGLYPLHSGISNNDHPLNPDLPSFARACKESGYSTAYIGKWHLDGLGRTAYIPEERRLGFDHWQALECTHNYFESQYFENNEEKPNYWEGYDAEAQKNAAIEYIVNRDEAKPFFLMLSWGPPHDPYIAPEKYQSKVNPMELILRPNVSEHQFADELLNNPRFAVPEKYMKSHQKLRTNATNEQKVRERYGGYLAAILALDDYFGDLLQTLEQEGLLGNTIIAFTSDHGDHLGSHHFFGKNTPFIESISIPFLLRFPEMINSGSVSNALLSPVDMFPTIFGIADLPYGKVDGIDLSSVVLGEQNDHRDAILLMNLTHFNNTSLINGLDTYRGVQTKKYTYARYEDKTPWLLFDNENDPYQMTNLAAEPAFQELIESLNAKLDQLLMEAGDSESTKLIYDRIIKENPNRQLLVDIRNANPDKY